MSYVVQTAVVTGASSGIGVAYAERLARRGHNLILVARRRDRLDALATKLTAETSRKVEVLVADLAKPDGVRSVEKLLVKRQDVDILVNNAGLGALGPATKTDPDAVESLVLVNVLFNGRAPGFPETQPRFADQHCVGNRVGAYAWCGGLQRI